MNISRRLGILLCVALGAILGAPRAEAGLADVLGRNETRVYAAPFVPPLGRTVQDTRLGERLDRLGYARVRHKPRNPGEYFWGHDVFWIYRRAHRAFGRRHPEVLLGLRLRREDGRVLGFVPDDAEVRLEPELLAESLTETRAPRRPIALEGLPAHVHRAVLAAEDARFFDHVGIDGKALARAALQNARRGKVVQGGSTITQQLIKLRDLTPKRSIGRKLSEAARALALEAEYDKREILEAYLNTVYFGHVGGVSLYGIGAASRAYWSKDPADLDLAEAALLAAMIQGPNRLSPQRHLERLLLRQRWVLGRMRELGWADEDAVVRATRAGVGELRVEVPRPTVSIGLLAAVHEAARQAVPGRLQRGRGVVIETSLDPLLQRLAEESVALGLARLRQRHGGSLSAAFVALDAGSGDILALVGADPASPDAFDRTRSARRQPGSTVKPLLLLEAFEDCGERAPLYPSRRVADQPLRVELPSGAWEPSNPDDRFRGEVSIREALVDSLNVPFVRTARWCGFEQTARRMRRAGLALPEPLPPSFALGAVETSPLELAEAYTVLANDGRRTSPRLVRRVRRPSGRSLERIRSKSGRVVGRATAYLVRDILADAVERGTARAARLDGLDVWGKTGTSSGSRDAWFVGGVGARLAVAWVGRDDDRSLGASGSQVAAPIWRSFMAAAAATAPPRTERPPDVVEHWVEERSGLRVGGPRRGARTDLFRRGSEPPRRRLFRRDPSLPAVR